MLIFTVTDRFWHEHDSLGPNVTAPGCICLECTEKGGNHDVGTIDMVGRLNRQLAGWAVFYKFTDFTARTFRADTRSKMQYL